MSLRFLRLLGVLFLLASLAVPARMADAATRTKSHKSAHTTVRAVSREGFGSWCSAVLMDRSSHAFARAVKRRADDEASCGGITSTFF